MMFDLVVFLWICHVCVIICDMMQFMLSSYTLKKNYILVLESCHTEDKEEDNEEGDDPLLEVEEEVGVKIDHLVKVQWLG